MPPKPTQPFQNRHTYIPPHVQQAMDRQMRQSMPEHLRKYTEGNSYVPRHAERAITEHMEKVMPGQFKKYAGSYVQQKVMSQHLAIASATPHLPAQDNFHPAVPQPGLVAIPGATITPTPAPAAPEPTPTGLAPQPGQPQSPTPAPPPYPSGQAPTPAQQPDTYGFITNPEQPTQRRGLSLPTGSSAAMRAAFMAGGLLVLIILFIVVKGLVSGSGNLTPFVGVAQDQQELIHLVANATQQQGLMTGNQNFAATAQLSLASSQAAILKYLTANGQKTNLKLLSAKVSVATDNQLTAAAAATTYDQTFQGIMETKLTAYISDLQQAYQQSTGKNGRALLSNTYVQAQLLLTQINAAGQATQ